MKNALLFLLVCLLPLGVFGRQEASSGQKSLVFTHVTVIDATGAPAKPDMTVVIEGDRIAALGKTANLDVPRNAQIVDATGKFLIPGLWDMHVHPVDEKNYLALFTANGVTGVRVMRGEPVHHKWRQEISSGKLIGPRMVIASPLLGGQNTVVSNEEEGRQLVRKYKKEGADFLKIYTYISRDAYFAIADEAKKQGIPFAGHVPLSVSVAEASDAGQLSIEHGWHVSVACSTEEEELIKKVKETLVPGPSAARDRLKLITDITHSEKKAAELFSRFVKNSTWVCPTFMVWHGMLFNYEEDIANDPRIKYLPLSIKDRWKNIVNDVQVGWETGEWLAAGKKLGELHLAMVGEMRRAGVGLLAGTDATSRAVVYSFPGFSLHDELVVFVQAGLSPMEALQTATYNAAKCMGLLDSMGTIEQGKIADLVLLDANPLQDISNTRRITTVVVGGRVFDKTALQKMLIQVEAQVNLHKAARDGDLEQVKKLIAQGVDVNASNGDEKWTALLAAAHAGHADVINVLLKNGAKVDAGSYGYTPLYYAIWSKDVQSVRALISGGADVNAKKEKGMTQLHFAAREGLKEIVELLLAHGAYVNIGYSNNNWTAAELAMRNNHWEIVQLLVSKGADISPLHLALYMKDEAKARSLIEGGADVNRRTPNGTTPLNRAIGKGFKNIVELLIARGADVNAGHSWGWTPLHGAAEKGYKDIVELLITEGANVNARDGAGRTPLFYAKDQGNNEIVELLRKHGAKE